MTTLALAPRNDISELAAAYKKDGFVRVPGLFPQDVADYIYDVLTRGTPWHLVHSNQAGREDIIEPAKWQAMADTDRRKLISDTLVQARDGFSYLYSCFPMIDAYLENRFPEWPLHNLTVFLNTVEVHNLVKQIIGDDTISKLDCQATLYERGHFLNRHDDTGHDAERRAAYVIGFSKDWDVNWGGQLLFLEDDRVKNGFSPSFNTMTLFKVPIDHIVTQVTNFAGRGRYSVTGWARVD